MGVLRLLPAGWGVSAAKMKRRECFSIQCFVPRAALIYLVKPDRLYRCDV